MAMGYGLQNLLQSPMAGGQQGKFPDPTALVSQIMGQFEEWLRKRGAGASMGRQGIQQPVTQQPMAQQPPLALGGGMGAGSASGMPAIQAPVGIPPRKRAGGLREAGVEGATTFMEQAGEEAAEPWKPKGLDIALLGASIALPIIAALQPEGKGRRGQRKQQRMSSLFKTLGVSAGKGLEMRMGSFKTGKEAEYEAAKKIADISLGETGTKYEHEIGRIGAAEGRRRWEADYGLKERELELKALPKPEPEKRFAPPGPPRTLEALESLLRLQGKTTEADKIHDMRMRGTMTDREKALLRIWGEQFGIKWSDEIRDIGELGQKSGLGTSKTPALSGREIMRGQLRRAYTDFDSLSPEEQERLITLELQTTKR